MVTISIVLKLRPFRNTNSTWRRWQQALLGVAAIVALTAVPAHALQPQTLSINPRVTWTDTGIAVRAGDRIEISASGAQHFGRGAISALAPTGVPWGPRCNAAARAASQAGAWPAPGIACWSLIARVGQGAPIAVGAGRVVTADRGGRLELGVNDDLLIDNRGSWSVRVAVVSHAVAAGSDKHATKGSLPSLAIVIALGGLGALVGASLFAGSRRRPRRTNAAPAVDAIERPATAVSPEDENVYIFDVELDGNALHVGYSYFPAETTVRWRITSDDGLLTGEFVAQGGPESHALSIDLSPAPARSARTTVSFTWKIGAAPFEYSVTAVRV